MNQSEDWSKKKRSGINQGITFGESERDLQELSVILSILLQNGSVILGRLRTLNV